MFRRFLMMAVFTAVVVGAVPVGAQQPQQLLSVSSGGEKGTYYQMMKELADACPGQIENRSSNGSLDNLDRILGNKSVLGVTQFDALFLRGVKEEDIKNRIRVLAVLHPEEVHFIAKSAGRSDGGSVVAGIHTGFNEHLIPLNTILDLRGLKVGYWGGSSVTESIIAQRTGINWQPVEFTDQKAALAALKADQIDAILAVGGQPLAWVAELSREFKLLEVPEYVGKTLDMVYDQKTLSYRNLNQDGVRALAVDAMLVTRNYQTPQKREPLKRLRDCLVENVPVIQETTDTHPKWMSVTPLKNVSSKWAMFFEPAPAIQAKPQE